MAGSEFIALLISKIGQSASWRQTSFRTQELMMDMQRVLTRLAASVDQVAEA